MTYFWLALVVVQIPGVSYTFADVWHGRPLGWSGRLVVLVALALMPLGSLAMTGVLDK